MQTILVTGGAGFIGSNLCDTLLQKGYKVICVDDFNDFYDPIIKERNIAQAEQNPNFSVVKADITDLTALSQIFEADIHAVIHLAARAGVRPSLKDPELYERVNVQGTRNLLQLCAEHKISNFVFASSSSIYGTNTKIPFNEEDPVENMVSPYAKTKKKGEELCHEFYTKHGMDIACLRFFTVYGPRGRPEMAIYKFTKNISEGNPIDMYGNGTTKRDYTYVADIVKGIIAALENNQGFNIINIGNNNPIELRKLIETIEKAVGKKAIINQMPEQEGDVPLTYADITKAQQLFNYSPSTSIEEGIKKFVEWYNSQRSSTQQ